jgi:hypothetical protein
MRQSVRRLLTVATVMVVLAVLAFSGGGPRGAVARAAEPDVYQVTAGSSVVDTDLFQTGSAVDPSPLANTAFPLTSVTSNNQPQAEAHAAYVEPPTLAQTLSNANNIPLPYAGTEAEALCADCSTPVSQNADGNLDQRLDGTRISLGAGHAHARASRLSATGDAGTGSGSIGPLDQLTALYDGAVASVYANVVNKPGQSPPPAPFNSPPGCRQAPDSALTPNRELCPAQPPGVSVVAQAGGSRSYSTVVTDDRGTAVETLSSISATRLLNGLISVATISTEVKASGDGTAAGTSVDAVNAVQGVCVDRDCGYSITSQGICKSTATLCSNDPVNRALRQQGFNLCRLSASTARDGTTVVGDAQGLLLEWHVITRKDGSSAPDPDYYRSFGDSACEPALSTPHNAFTGTSFYLKIGRSEAQLTTASFPGCTRCTGAAVPPATQGGAATTSGSTVIPSSSTGDTLEGGGTGSAGGSRPVADGSVTEVARLNGVRDRRPLMLAAFALLELVLLCNLSAMALRRRTSS